TGAGQRQQRGHAPMKRPPVPPTTSRARRPSAPALTRRGSPLVAAIVAQVPPAAAASLLARNSSMRLTANAQGLGAHLPPCPPGPTGAGPRSDAGSDDPLVSLLVSGRRRGRPASARRARACGRPGPSPSASAGGAASPPAGGRAHAA